MNPLTSNQSQKAVPYSESSLKTVFAHYKTFSLTGFTDNYRISVSGYTGTAGNGLRNISGTTFQVDDFLARGGWWFEAKYNKDRVDLNALWDDDWYFMWLDLRPFDIQASEMKVRLHA